jgi:hypothetical protein
MIFDVANLSETITPDKFPIIIISVKSTSPRFAIAENIILAIPHSTFKDGKKLCYISGLDFTESGLKTGCALTELIGNLSSSFLFINGENYSFKSFGAMAKCFTTAMKCKDKKAYCWQYKKIPADDIVGFSFFKYMAAQKKARRMVKFKEIIIPCINYTKFNALEEKPMCSLRDRFQAFTAKEPFCLCPLFRVDDVKVNTIVDEIEMYEEP